MNLGGMPDITANNNSAEENHSAEMEKMKQEIKWLKYAIILLGAYLLYQTMQNKTNEI